jgi:hypothetical protein
VRIQERLIHQTRFRNIALDIETRRHGGYRIIATAHDRFRRTILMAWQLSRDAVKGLVKTALKSVADFNDGDSNLESCALVILALLREMS